jgi:hypothetical protein
MKLALRFIFVPVFLAAFSYLFYSAYKDVKDRTLAEFNTQQLTLAKQASRGIESFFIYYKRELLFLSKLKYVSELDDLGKDLLADFYKNHSDQIEEFFCIPSHSIKRS